MVNGYVNAEPGYPHTTAVMNPFSELIIDLYGTDTGSHARTAIGVAIVPLNLPSSSRPDCRGLPGPLEHRRADAVNRYAKETSIEQVGHHRRARPAVDRAVAICRSRPPRPISTDPSTSLGLKTESNFDLDTQAGGGFLMWPGWRRRLNCAPPTPCGPLGDFYSNMVSRALVVPVGWSVQKRPEPVGVNETPEMPFATTVTVPVETMGMTGAAAAMMSCAFL
jgi:hypothetical protein